MAVTLYGEVKLNSSNSTLWALHNPLKPWTLYNLSEAELRLLILSLSESELRLVKICKKNDGLWQTLDKTTHQNFFAKNLGDLYFTNTDYPVVEAKEESFIDRQYFVIKPSKVLHPRLHTRYELPVSCVLVGSNNKEFVTETIDLSEGGFHFKDVIPSSYAGYFLVIVESKYQLMCSLVEDQKEKKRVQIVSEESDYHFLQYKNWLETL